MIANGKIQISVTASYKDGHFLCQEREFVADTMVRGLNEPAFSVLEIRIVVPSQDAEELVRGLLSGRTELLVEKIPPLLDLEI
ncbi:MAG: hypothetical protein WCC59_06960 [Terriglobales bacterium]